VSCGASGSGEEKLCLKKDLAPLSLAIPTVPEEAESEGGQAVSLSVWGRSGVSALPGKGRRPGSWRARRSCGLG